MCAAIVFFSHWHLWAHFTPVGTAERFFHAFGDVAHDAFTYLAWPTGGHHPAVLGFFVLSGFCIHYPFERRARSGGSVSDWRAYFHRRFLRIVPVYWAACALGFVFVAAQIYYPAPSPLLALHAASSTEDILIRVTGLAGIYPREIFAGNYILTTVTVEIFMYALYPLIHRSALRGQWRGLALAFVALHLFAIYLLRWFSPYWVFNSIFMFGVFWFAGAYAAHLHLARRNRVRAGWFIAAWLLFLAVKSLPSFYGLNLLKQAAWASVCVLGILWAVRWEEKHPALAARRSVAALRWLGDISYSLYAMHTPAIMLATWALLHLGLQSYPLQLAATMAASLIAVLGTHYALERRFYRRTT